LRWNFSNLQGESGMIENRCRRCGVELERGAGRYIMILTFVADVEVELEEPEEDLQGNIRRLLEEIEHTPEEKLVNQVYQKEVYLICRRCKEELAENPFGSRPPNLTETIQ